MGKFGEAKHIIEKAIVAESALEWLEQYAPKLSPVGRDQISAKVNQNHANSCPGASNAALYLQEAIQEAFVALSLKAIELATRDIAAAHSTLSSAAEE